MPTLIDVSEFKSLVKEAEAAFSKDSTYFESMFTTVFKVKLRHVKASLRKELRIAEFDARKQCVASDIRACYNVSPCGTGRCPFAQNDLARLRVPDQPGKATRPQRRARIKVGSTQHSISLDAIVYESPTNATFKMVNTHGSWRMYKPDSILDMVASPAYDSMIQSGSLVLAPDSPNGIAPKLDSFVETYDIENAIEPLMKLRKIAL